MDPLDRIPFVIFLNFSFMDESLESVYHLGLSAKGNANLCSVSWKEV